MPKRTGRACALAGCALVVLAALSQGQMPRTESQIKPERRAAGTVQFEFHRVALAAVGLDLAVRGEAGGEDAGQLLSSTIHGASALDLRAIGDHSPDVSTANIETYGAVMLSGGGRRVVVGNLIITNNSDGSWTVRDGLGGAGPGRVVFDVFGMTVDAPRGSSEARMAGELSLSKSLAAELGIAEANRPTIGRVLIASKVLDSDPNVPDSVPADPLPGASVGSTATVLGPDVIVGNLYQIGGYGSSGGTSAYAVGTVSCNVGDVWLNWFSFNNQHPVIGQNAFRLKNGRFEQIGQSWLKHGFYALSEGLCFTNCQATNGEHLGVHCSDPYTASLNGTQSNLGPKYQVDASTGVFSYPPANPGYSGILARRLQIKNSDLNPAQDGGGSYFVEGQYVSPDDATAGNQNNNASYRPVTVSGGGSSWTISLAGTTQREQPAIRAWKDTDPTVTETDVQVSGDGLFIVSAKATDLGTGYWHYEYAVQNLNSHRSAKAFSVPVDPVGKILNIGFHDVDYHSNEIWSSTDWTSVVSNGFITWSTIDYSVNPSANALRWGTLYNFRFDSNRAPQTSDAILTLFRPGSPSEMMASTVGPSTAPPDCNGNEIPDLQDIINGTSEDCDNDGVPDECEGFTPTAVQVATGLTHPVYVTAPPGDLDRLFIVEQGGRVKILSGGSVLPTPFLDLSGQVSNDSEQGLLSIAFDPDYSGNGRFYVDYTDLVGDTVISRFTVSANPDVADQGSELVLKTISHPSAPNHNGGQLQFGTDGYLYAAIGDGGGSNDPPNRAQNTGLLLGKMLRLDVNNPPGYVPASNPFVGPGLPLDEIWAIGLRNPWRFSFDRDTGDLYVADVGQSSLEEINFQSASSSGGQNYGWRCMEGTSCTGLSGCTCGSGALTSPIAVYPHAGGDCSITGGYVYRGCAFPNLLGTYFYADFCSGAIRSFRYSGGQLSDLQDRTAQLTPAQGAIQLISSFGEDAAGELYIVSHNGSIYKIVPLEATGPVCGNTIVEAGEQCDDGNTSSGDGCSATCQAESTPFNDDCADAMSIGNGVISFNTGGAGTDGPNELALCNAGPSPVGSDIWYCHTASCTGTVTASLCDSSYDTMIAVYDGCTCPMSPSAMDCDDDVCGLQSSISFQATACDQYLIRVGGFQAAQGAGELALGCVPDPIVNDCNQNAVDDAADIACGTPDNNHNGVPDVCEVTGDYIRGGRLYDRWWSAIAASAPTTDHPLWPFRPDQTSNTATGAATWRCTECHGWDYKGVDGEYSVGPHRTGIRGVFETSLQPFQLLSLLRDPPNNGGGAGVANGHDYGSVLATEQMNDLIAFVLGGVVNTTNYVSETNGAFFGNPVTGEGHYTTGGTQSQCISCHGADGAAINFGTPQSPKYLGTTAVNEPYVFLHRARMGFPGTPMLGWLANGGTDQGAADIGRYAQQQFPVECIDNSQCTDAVACTEDSCDANGRCQFDPNDALCADDGVFCNGIAVCDPLQGCIEYGSACLVPEACDEGTTSCGCDAPQVSAAGPRYLAIVPQATTPSIPFRLLVTPNCPPQGLGKYLAAPSGPYSVASPVADPADAAILTRDEWGATVYVTGTHIVPGVEYLVQADCGVTGRAAVTVAAVAQTPIWGDVIGWIPPNGERTGPDGRVDVVDIVAVVDTFKHLPHALPVQAADLYGCTPNRQIDVTDIVGDVDAFKSYPYPHAACASPCE